MQANIRKLTIEFIECLQKADAFDYVKIYSQNKLYTKLPVKGSTERYTKFGKYYVTKNIDVTKCVEYNNPDTITVAFDGELYDLMNYYSDNSIKFIERIEKLFKKYGLYYEQGYAWSFALYEL